MPSDAAKYIPFLDPNRTAGQFKSEDIGTDTLLATDIAAGAVGNAELASDAVTDIKVAAAAAIALSKLATGALPAGITVASANIVDGTIVDIDVSAAAAIAGSKISPNVTNAIIGVAAGYKIARGETAVTGTADIATGLATVVQTVACLEADAALTATLVTVADSVTAGNVILKVWKPTSAADGTPIASITATSVRWIAVGT